MNYTPKDGFPYYHKLAKEGSVQFVFSEFLTFSLLQSIDDEKANHQYQTDKWTIKQIVGHITDHERIKMFRAFRLSRNEELELWGYDQEALVDNSRFNALSIQLLLKDYFNVRKASISFIETLSNGQLQKKGNARQHTITLEEFLRSIIGHERHHIKIIKERYKVSE